MPKNKRGFLDKLFGKKKPEYIGFDDSQSETQDFGDNSFSQEQMGGDQSSEESSTLDLIDDDESMELIDFGDDGVGLEDPPDDGENGETVTFIKEMKVKKKSKSQRSDTSGKQQRGAKKAIKQNDALGAVIHAAGWSRDPAHTKAAVNARFPKGPGITPAEWEAIVVLSSEPDGREWLTAAGMFSVDDAQIYLGGGNFRDFHMLHRAQKLILAKMAFDQNLVGTPPFWVGRSIMARDPNVSKDEQQHLKDEIDRDTMTEWARTLDETQLTDDGKEAIQQGAVPDPKDDKAPALDEETVQKRINTATGILRKVFVLLHAGMKVYDKKGNPIDFEGPVSKALSHGGRVNVRIPMLMPWEDQDRSHALTDWLGITTDGHKDKEDGTVFKRDYGTHHMTVKKDKKDGSQGRFKEDGGKIAAMKSKVGKTKLYGMNLGIGGIGRTDFNGDVILPDGAHGHMFIGFNPPNYDRDGALQLGIETTGPHAPSTVGYVHNWNSTEKTANPISTVGGLKQDKIGDQRIVDLNDMDGDWLAGLQALDDKLQELGTMALVGPQVQ